jgi:alkanesulfonate monooxygenase SsuD/methylene tetrahydromethanopterin reductase-like flavin-dependent oxidoreductase (luciferase family)
MKYGLQVLNSWSARNNVGNNSQFLVDIILEAEDAGWDGFFLWDHLMFPWPIETAEPWTVLSAASSLTEKIILGTAVTPVTRRRPQVLAKQLVTLDELSGGRVVLGAGLGGGGKQDAGKEFSAFGEPNDYNTLAEVGDEALDVIIGLWKEENFSYNGKHFHVDNVTFLPKPVQEPRIPIWIGGITKPAIRRAAKYDGWISIGPSPTVGEKGLSLKKIEQFIKEIKELRGSSSFDVCYGLEFPEEPELKKLIAHGEEIGITWMQEMIFGLKYNKEEVFERIRSGPPDY